MFFSAQKNKCCSLDFHQDHNIYYRAKKTAVYTPTAQEFKELESENGQLKQILGEKDLEIAILRDLIKKSQPGYRTKLR